MLKDILVEMKYLLNNSSVSYGSVLKKIVICGKIISHAWRQELYSFPTKVLVVFHNLIDLNLA